MAVDAELAGFGIEDRAGALPTKRSSGRRRRLALAAALVRPDPPMVADDLGCESTPAFDTLTSHGVT